MATEASSTIEDTHGHKHYLYQLFFDNVRIYEDMTSCNRKNQDQLMKDQTRKIAKDYPEGYKYLLYTSSNICIYCLVTKRWLKASDAVATRNFLVTEVPIEAILDVPPVTHSCLSHAEVSEIFDSKVVSSYKVSQIVNKMDEVLMSFGNQENFHASVLEFRTMLQEQVMSARELNYELPYNQWLFELVTKKLSPNGFCILAKNQEEPIAAANEYIFSQSDLLVYHPKKCIKHVQALHVAFAKQDVLMQRYEINKYNVTQLVGELKVEKINTSAENECYYNMFNEAARLALKILSSGKLIENITVYGITVAAHQHEFARLLTLKIDLDRGVCKFERCPTLIPFTILFNRVINILEC